MIAPRAPRSGTHWIALASMLAFAHALSFGATAHAEPAETLRLLPPEPQPGGWRIAWQSIEGSNYELQRWDGSNLDGAQRPDWQPVTRVLALGPVTAIDELSAGAARRFYRVALRSTGPAADEQPPVLAGFRADLLGVTTTAPVHLTVTATDPSGVREVLFLVEDRLLGPGQREGDRWSLEVPYAQVAASSRVGVRATDSLGNTTTLERAPPQPTDAARRFLALDPSGRPIAGSSIPLSPGPLPPLQFLPGGAVSERDSLAVKLPLGSQLAVSAGREVLRFSEVEIRLGRDTAFQLDPTRLVAAQPGLHGAPPTRTLTAIDNGVRVVSTTPLELPTGPLTAADLETLLGIPPGEGVPLRVFDRFNLRWHAGVLEDTGIRGGRYAFTDLPLPPRSGDYPDHLLPLAGIAEVRIPYHGRYAWPGGGATAPELQLGPADPGWLTLRPDGSMGWHNRSEIRFPGGGRIRVDIGLDDPLYRLGILADSVQVPLIGNLAELILPDDPAACLLPGLDPVALTRATGCLEALGLAYLNVSASAVAAAPIPENPETGALAEPPDDLDTSVSVLNAWGHRAVAAVGPALPMAPQRELLSHTGHSAAAATDLASAARHRAALARAAAALHRGELTGSAEDLAALNAALDEATAAALLRARDPAGTTSYAALLEALRSPKPSAPGRS